MAIGHDELESVFQICLEKVQSGQETVDSVLSSYPEQASVLRPGLEALDWLQGQTRLLDPRPGFIESSRRRLALRIGQEKAVPTPARFSRPWRLSLQLILALVIIVGLLIGVSGAAIAAQNAIPGDTLYSLKIASENAQLALTPGLTGEARLYIRFAERRMLEIQALVLKEKYQYIHQTALEFERQVALATQLLKMASDQGDVRAASLAVLLKENLVNQSGMLAVLNGVIPEGIRADFNQLNLAIAVGISSADKVIEMEPGLPTSTGTSEAPAAATPIPIMLPTDTIEPTPTDTLTPSPDDTPAGVDSSATISPSIVPNFHQVTPTPTPTLRRIENETSTSKPTRTPRPERTPKPTKEKDHDRSTSLPDLED